MQWFQLVSGPASGYRYSRWRHFCRPPVYGSDVVGVNLAQSNSLPITLLAGKYPAVRSSTEVDVTQAYLTRLGLPDSAAHEVIGTDVELGAFRVLTRNFSVGLRWSSLEIVGVVNQQVGSGQFLAYPGLVATDVRWTAGGRANGDSDAPQSPYIGALVEADQLSGCRSGPQPDRRHRLLE